MLRIPAVGKNIFTQSNDKKSHFFIDKASLADYAKTFKLDEMTYFDFAQKATKSGFVSFTLKNAPTQVMHTLYISVPEEGSSLLFTAERFDIEEKLNLFSTQNTAASLASYEMTPDLSTQIKAWCEENNYDTKFIPDEQRHAYQRTFNPQAGKKKALTKALTRTLNEMMGKKWRSSLLRNNPDWEHISANQLMNCIQNNPKGFLQENLLTFGLLNSAQPIFFNEISVGHYQISNVEMPKHVEIRADCLPFTNEVELLLSEFKGLSLSSLNSNFLVISPLILSTLAIKTVDGETFIAHVQPDFKLKASHDTARHIHLQTELKRLGWHTFGPKDYKEVPTRVYGFKDKGEWHFYSQSGQHSIQRVQRIFKTTKPFLYEDVVRNNRILRKRGNFIIEAPGVDSVTFMKTGLMSGEELYEYLMAKHENGIVTSFEVHLHSSGSANGGVASSQAQVLADLAKITVVGYEGEFVNEEQSLQNARKFKPRTDLNVKADTARRNRIKAKWEKLKLYSKNKRWSRETITDKFEPDPFLPDFVFEELIPREKELTEEVKAFLVQDAKVQILMQSPANRCLDAALQVYKLIEDHPDFNEIKIFNLGIWNQFLGKLAFSWANHYAIKVYYKGMPLVIDPTAGQFVELGAYAMPLFTSENNWKAIYQIAWKNKPNFLLKLAEVNSFYDAPFSSFYSFSAFQHNAVSVETKVLSRAKWYDERMFAIYKKSRAQTKEMEEAFRASLTQAEANDLDFRFTWH